MKNAPNCPNDVSQAAQAEPSADENAGLRDEAVMLDVFEALLAEAEHVLKSFALEGKAAGAAAGSASTKQQ